MKEISQLVKWNMNEATVFVVISGTTTLGKEHHLSFLLFF